MVQNQFHGENGYFALKYKFMLISLSTGHSQTFNWLVCGNISQGVSRLNLLSLLLQLSE